jgi:hypothetical protein
VATEAISHEARPMVMMPSRRGPAATIRATAHDSARNTVVPAARAASRDSKVRVRRRSAAGSIVTAVPKTRMTRRILMP